MHLGRAESNRRKMRVVVPMGNRTHQMRVAFVEIDGEDNWYELARGQSMIIETADEV